MISKIILKRDKNSGKYFSFEVINDNEMFEVKNTNYEIFKKEFVNYVIQLAQDNYQDEYSNMTNKEIREDLMKKGLLEEKEIIINKTSVLESKETQLPTEAKVKGRKKLKVSKKTLALIVGGAIALSGLGVGINALVNANKKENSNSEEDSYSNNDQFGTMTSELPDPTTNINNISYQNNSNLSYIYEDIQEFNQNEMSNIALFENSLDNYYQISRDNFASISEYRYNNDYQILGDGEIIPFENATELVDNNFIDKAFVKYFSDLRNQVINAFYNEKDENRGLIFINVAGDELIRCLKFNESISYEHNGSPVSITYNNLSNEAKKVVLNIATDLYSAMYKYDTFTYNDLNYNMDDVNETIIELSNQLENSKTK